MKWLAQLVAPASLLTWWPDDHLYRYKVRAIYLGAAPAAVKAESSS
jgi:hypothetical protein